MMTVQRRAWQTLGSETLTAATTPQRMTFDYAVAVGRYEVRALRTDAKDTSARAGMNSLGRLKKLSWIKHLISGMSHSSP